MTVNELFLSIFLISATAGCIGSLTGLGGGIMVIPILCFLKFDLHFAMGTGLAVGVTNSLVGTALLKRDNLTYLKLGMFLETGIAIGAILGALAVAHLSVKFLTILFGFVLLATTFSSFFSNKKSDMKKFDAFDKPMPDLNQLLYTKVRLAASWCFMFIAGSISGLLGIGSGVLKVLAMDMILGLPYKVSTSTSTFMVGITAATTLGVYMSHGYIKLPLVVPAILGTALGGYFGALWLVKGKTGPLRILFNLVILGLSLEMLYKGLSL